MKCEGNYVLAQFKERPNRFLALVDFKSSNGAKNIIKVHVPDPGRLKELLIPKANIILKNRKSPSPKRKTQYSLVGVKQGNLWVNINSQISNRLFQEEFHKLSFFHDYRILKSEYRFEKSRIDFLMENMRNNQKTLVEIKSVTLVDKGVALFPDAPTLRGVKHVNHLITAVTKGFEAIIVFVIKRSDVTLFKPNKKLDPKFAFALTAAHQNGVKIFAVKCSYDPITSKELNIIGEVPIKLS
ncbi:MAG: DNA/RNA nuclease SfsA [Candidatus Hodarchaeales archaeon]|jgi:sugar fermentation stimulation protein A